jgi:electron-transferring-flavoprotein dehydrogenase
MEAISMVETDVLVIGGGPAGVLSALTSAKNGNKVMLIDSKTYEEIGNKTCGDAIDLGPLTFIEEKLGLEKPHDDEVAENVERLIFKTSNVEFPLEGIGYVLNRHPYGQRLLNQAEEYGVEVIPNTKAVRAIVEEGVVKGAVVRKNRKDEYDIMAKITIDCSGRNFQIRRTFSQEDFPWIETKMEKKDIAASYREIIKLKEDHPYRNEIYLIYRKEIPEPAYFWIFSKGERRLNVGIGWFLDMKAQRGMKDLFWEVLHKYYPPGTYEVEDKGGYTIPTRYPMTNAVANGFLTAGDAAFHVSPLSAEGHGPALVAGYYAGMAASEAIKTNDISEEKLWQYNVNVMEHFGLSHTKVQLFTEALLKIKVSGLEFLLKRNILTREQFLDLHAGRQMGIFDMLRIAVRAFPRYVILMQVRKIAKEAEAFERLFASYPKNPEDYPSWLDRFNKKMTQIRNR